ncbi:MAG: DUF4870 domain-containing protein [Lysobacteraceae bacterium]
MSEFESPQIPSDDAPSAQARQMGMFTHLSSLAGLIIPFGNILGPLILWQVKKAEFPFVDDQGKEALNFNITMAIAGLVAALLTLLLIGFLLLPVIALAWLVFTIIAALKANEGVAYRYPFTLRLIK